MHDQVRQMRKPRQAGRLVEVGDDRNRPGRSQFVAPRRLTGDGEDAEAIAQQRQHAHADVAAAEDQEARPGKFDIRFFHFHHRDCMTFQVTVQPSGRQFSCEDDETVLAAAIRAGVGLPYGCKNGACGSCKGKLLEGTVTHRAHQEKALPPADEAKGFSLFCCATPQSDIVIEAREVLGVGEFPIKKLPTRVAKID